MSEEIAFDSLIGLRMLSGVDFSHVSVKNWGDNFEDCQVMNFTLDGITYTACEDPYDGYRSSLRYLRKAESPTTNNFVPVSVMARMKDRSEYGGECCIIELIDCVTGKQVLEVGTDNSDDYYPSFVANFTPENMSINVPPII